MCPVVPPKSNRKVPWEYDKELYKGRMLWSVTSVKSNSSGECLCGTTNWTSHTTPSSHSLHYSFHEKLVSTVPRAYSELVWTTIRGKYNVPSPPGRGWGEGFCHQIVHSNSGYALVVLANLTTQKRPVYTVLRYRLKHGWWLLLRLFC